MSEKIRVPFQFHLRSVQCVSPEEAAQITQSSGHRVGPNDVQIPGAEFRLDPSPELDRRIRDARRAYASGRAAQLNRARLGDALANAAFQPRDIPSGAAGPAAALYQNILPPRPASSPPDGASAGGASAQSRSPAEAGTGTSPSTSRRP